MSELEQDYASTFKSKPNMTKFKVFHYMINWFSFIYHSTKENTQSFFSSKEEKLNNNLYNELSQSYDEFLMSNLLNINCEMIQNGYQPSKSQYDLLMKKINHEIALKPDNILEYKPFFQNIPEGNLSTWIVCHHDSYNKYNKNYQFIYEQAEQIDNFYENLVAKNISMIENALNYFITNFEMRYKSIKGMASSDNKESLDQLSKNIVSSLNLLSDFHEHISLETTLKTKRCIENVVNKIETKIHAEVKDEYKKESFGYCRVNNYRENAKKIESIIKSCYSNHKDRLINKVKMLNNGYTESIIKVELDDKQSIQLKNDLPQDVLSILKDIEEKYKFLCNNTTNNPLVNIHEVNNLYQHKVPDIVKKYLLIAPEYRLELKNVEGKDAKQLMLESLTNIQTVFNENYQNTNELLLRDLSASQRHTKAIKNKM